MAAEDGVLFDSTRAVLQFAFNVPAPEMPRPFMNKAMAAQQPKKPSKKALQARKRAALDAALGLVPRELSDEPDPLEGTRRGGDAPRLPTGLDAAHLAGIILQAFKRIEPSHQALLTAACAERRHVCVCSRPCCSGWTPNRTWSGAVQAIMEVLQHSGEVLQKPNGKARRTRGLSTHPRLRQTLVESYFTGRPPTVTEMAAASEVTKETVARHRDWIWAFMEQEEAAAWRAADELFDSIGIVGCRYELKE